MRREPSPGGTPFLARALEWRIRQIESNPHARMGFLRLLRRGGEQSRLEIPLSFREGIQNLRLRRTVRWVASRSPFYRAKFAEMGIEANRVRGVCDVASLPLTTSDDIMEPDRFLCAAPDEIARIYTTSGTSREPKRIYRTARDFERLVNVAAFLLRSRRWEERLVCMIAHAQGLFGLAEPAEVVVQRAGGLALPIGQPMPQEALRQLSRFRPNWLMTSPSYMAAMTTQAEREGLRMLLKSIVLDGEILTPEQARRFAEYWGADVVNGYGLTEVGVVGFGRHGCTALHLNWLNVHAEIVDPDSGRPADEGELVVTSLNQEGMPLLRYRTGDRVRKAGCRCGIASPAIHVFGRLGDGIVVAATNVHGPLIAEEVAGLEQSTGSLELLVDHVEGVDRMTLRVGTKAGTHLDPEAVERKLFSLYPALADDARAAAFQLSIEPVENMRLSPKPLRVRDLRR